MLTLQNIKEEVDELAKKIQAPSNVIPTFGISRRDGTPHIEIDGEVYYYMVFDRNITTHRKTRETQELLYWVFNDVTSQMGYSYNRAHRNPKADSRRLAFQHQLELLEILNRQWKEEREQEIEEILKVSPYRDKTG